MIYYASRKLRREAKRTTLPFGLANLSTDTTFMANRDDGLQCGDVDRKRAYARARAAGVNPSGKTYCPGLAKDRFDPEAWVSSKNDVKGVCERRGYDCEGLVNVKTSATDVEPPPYKVADDLVEKDVQKQIVENDLHPSPKQRQDMTEATQERLMPATGTPC